MNVIFDLNNNSESVKIIFNYIKRNKKIKISLGELSKYCFIDGEYLIKSNTSVRNKNVFIVQKMTSDKNSSINDKIIQLLIFIDTLKRASAKSINVILPYFCYARQDRKTAGREPITSKLIANLLEKAGVNRVTVLDFHSPQIQGFFNIPVDNLLAYPILCGYLVKKYKKDYKKLVIVAPDQGATKFCHLFSDLLEIPIIIASKRRVGHNITSLQGILGDPTNKIPIIVDDLIDTGGTITNVAELLNKKYNCKKIIICATHGVFSKGVAKNLNKKYIKEIIVTNSIYNVNDKNINNLTVIKIEKLLSDVITAWIQSESLSKVYLKYTSKCKI